MTTKIDATITQQPVNASVAQTAINASINQLAINAAISQSAITAAVAQTVINAAINQTAIDVTVVQADVVAGGGGGGDVTIDTEAAVSLVAGDLVRVRSDNKLDLATGNVVHGMCTVGAAPTFTATWMTDGRVTLSDWSAITGTTLLVVGAKYYLDQAVDGDMSTVVPALAGDYVIELGKAISTTKFDLEIKSSFLLS